MAIKNVVTIGYGSFSGVNFIPTLGFGNIGVVYPGRLEYTIPRGLMDFTIRESVMDYTLPKSQDDRTV